MQVTPEMVEQLLGGAAAGMTVLWAVLAVLGLCVGFPVALLWSGRRLTLGRAGSAAPLRRSCGSPAALLSSPLRLCSGRSCRLGLDGGAAWWAPPERAA